MAGLTDWLIKRHIAKDATSANYILIIVTITAFFSAIFISYHTFSTRTIDVEPPMKKSEVLPFIIGGLPGVSQKDIDDLPEFFYLEDIPESVRFNLPPEILQTIPRKP